MEEVRPTIGIKKLAEAEVETQAQFVCINPSVGTDIVKMTAKGRFLHATGCIQKTKSLNYYGNFNGELGLRLNARIHETGVFEIRTPENTNGQEFKHLGFSKILEVIHPTGDLQLVGIQNPGEFKVLLGSLDPVSESLALSLSVTNEIWDSIKRHEKNYFQDAIKQAYDDTYPRIDEFKRRKQFHLGLIDLNKGRTPILHYNIIKRQFIEILKTSNLSKETIKKYSIAEIGAPGTTIWLKPADNGAYKKINEKMRDWLMQFNKMAGTEYEPNGYTDKNYEPHITLIHGEVCKRINDNPHLVGNKKFVAELQKLWQKEQPSLTFIDSKYGLLNLDAPTASLVEKAKAKINQETIASPRFAENMSRRGIFAEKSLTLSPSLTEPPIKHYSTTLTNNRDQ